MNWKPKTISLKPNQVEWLNQRDISLSKFVQRKLEEEIQKEDK